MLISTKNAMFQPCFDLTTMQMQVMLVFGLVFELLLPPKSSRMGSYAKTENWICPSWNLLSPMEQDTVPIATPAQGTMNVRLHALMVN